MLKPIFIGLLVLLSFGHAFAQKQTIYFDSLQHNCSEAEAASYAIITKKAGLWQLTQYSMEGNKLMKGYYTVTTNGLKSNRDGLFTYYHESGNVKSEGKYEHNMKQGVWKYFTYDDARLKAEVSFRDDSLNGLYILYDKNIGKKAFEGNYINNKMDGFVRLYEDGVVSEEIRYLMGSLEGLRTVYDDEGDVIKRLTYKDNKLIESHVYSDLGKELRYTPRREDSIVLIYRDVDYPPRAGYDYNAFLAKNVHYPKQAEKNGIEGKVVVKFMIDEWGNIANATVLKGVDPEMDAEAIRVVSLFPRWVPCFEEGQPVISWIVLPIQFKLDD